MYKKINGLFVSMMIFTICLGHIASAHVVVYPQETTQGAYEKFTARVPSEKDIATTEVKIEIPIQDVIISRVEPKPDWTYEITKNSDSTITSITWTTVGKGLLAGEFTEFHMQGKVTDTAEQITWKAYQTYEDGSIVEWVGAEGSDTPASATYVNPKSDDASADSHGHVHSPAVTDEASSPWISYLTLILSIIAVTLGLIAVRFSVKKS